MISILVPVFNTEVSELVRELVCQLQAGKLSGEIIVYDDASDANYKMANQALAYLPGVVYIESPVNNGRIAIRKLLAAAAKHEWLLFLDGDSKIISSQFLNRYYNAITEAADVYTGGRTYDVQVPADCSKKLHWKYGRERESIKGQSAALHTNNFLIRKELFWKLPAPPSFKGYGYEDTWIDIMLHKAGKIIRHLDNPVLHDGVETTDVFLQKAKEAISNLSILSKTDEPLWKKQVTLYRAYAGIKKWRLAKLYLKLYPPFAASIEKNLYSCKPSLFFFDLFRLYLLIQLREAGNASGKN